MLVQILRAVMALNRHKRQERERLLAVIPELDSEGEFDVLTASHEVSPAASHKQASCCLSVR